MIIESLSDLSMLISFICFLSGMFWALYRRHSLNPFLFGTAAAVFFVFVSYRLAAGHITSSILSASLFNTFRVFLFNEDLTFVLERITDSRLHLYISSLYVIAPVLLIGSVVAYIIELSSRAKLIILRIIAREIYIFSEINEKSALLVEDLQKKGGRNCSIFASKPEIIEGELYDLVERAKKSGAIFQKNSIVELHWLKKLVNKQINWVLISDDQTLNLQQAIAVNELYKSTHKGCIFVFSEQPEAEMLLDSMIKEKLKVRRINEKLSIVFNLFTQYPLYQNCNDKTINLLVIGASDIGLACVRTAAWCCQMDGYSFKITCADNDAAAFDRFKLSCSELLQTCNIELRQINIDSTELWNLLDENLQASYVIIARQNDDNCSQTAINVRAYYERKNFGNKMPLIFPLMRSPEKANLIKSLINGQKQSYDFLPFGNKETIYKTDILFYSIWEKRAYEMHKWLGYGEVDFDDMEYNRKASIAAVVHMQYKLKSAGVETCEQYANYIEDADNLEKQVRAEHERWNAYMRSEGYVTASMTEAECYLKSINNHKNVMALKHSCLIDFDELDQLTALVQPYKSIDFKEQDVRSVKWLASNKTED